MKINKYWYLDNLYFPGRVRDICYDKASKQQFDEVTIIHYDSKEFTPIVLRKYIVTSEARHLVKEFYKGVLHLLRKEPFYEEISRFNAGYLGGDIYEWGCRRFTRKQLLLIKRTMEWHYGKENLV